MTNTNTIAKQTSLSTEKSVRASLRRAAAVATLALVAAFPAYGASTTISTSFRDATPPGWVFGGTGAVTNGGVLGS